MQKYKRVLLKLSGGAVSNDNGFGLNPRSFNYIAKEVAKLVESGVEVAIIFGGGNIFRGYYAEETGIERAEADNIGTLSTIINCLMLRGTIAKFTKNEIRLMTSVPLPSMAENYIRLKAISHLEKKRIVILGGGNGQPYVTTDYPSVQRALELNCDAILTAKNGVDGVYSGDPKKDPAARFYYSINYDDLVKDNLQVIDQSAFVLAKEHDIPMHVFNFNKENSMINICNAQFEGTFISNNVDTIKV